MWKDAPDANYGNLIWNNELARRMFSCPSSEEIKAKFSDFSKKHPYILLNNELIEKIRIKEQTNKEFAKWISVLRDKAVLFLSHPIEDFSDKKWSTIYHARQVKEKAEILGLFYLLDNKPEFADRLITEINAVLDMDWKGENYLIGAELCYSVALAYDWLYAYMSDTKRKEVESTLWNTYLLPALECHKEANGIGPDFLNHLDMPGWWTRCSSNWNMVCNGSLICSALAVADTDDTSFDIIEYALKGLPYTILQYLPDGGSEESAGYWKYAYSYFCKAMSALQCAVGTEYGFFKQPLMAQTINFPISLTGPCGTFNFHDSGIDAVADISELFYFANTLNIPFLAKMRQEQLEKNQVVPTVYDIIWHNSVSGKIDELPCDRYFRNSETASIRSSWDNDAFAVAFHAGYNFAIHSHLDMGSIIVDYLGERWFHDPGNEQITYTARGAEVNRWDLYRMRAEGHNTIVVNPDLSPDQQVYAECKITDRDFGLKCSSLSADLSAALNCKNTSWNRTVILDKENLILTLKDELCSQNENDIYWFAHTKADCTVSGDGKEVYLTQNSKSVVLTLNSPEDFKFYLMPAEPLPSSPVVDGQADNTDFTKIALHITDKKSVEINVTLKKRE